MQDSATNEEVISTRTPKSNAREDDTLDDLSVHRAILPGMHFIQSRIEIVFSPRPG